LFTKQRYVVFSFLPTIHNIFNQVKKGKLNPDWAPLSLSLGSLCNGDHQRPIRLKVEDWNKNGSHSLIGELDTSIQDLTQMQPGTSLALINEKKKKKKSNYKNSGQLILHSLRMETRPTFLDFIQNGTELNFIVAVDFTASNGNPSHNTSLHYNDPSGEPNQYITAIKSVGEIIQDYDSDKLFPALGFGARLPPDGRVSHEFPLKLVDSTPCEGISGILDAYKIALQNVQLYGPTNFSPVINHVAREAHQHRRNSSNFFVLLIITDGVITDLEATRTAIIQASALPMSIIIIGVGSEDFSSMDLLDSDDELLTDNQGRVAERDIVQFVELQRFVSGQGNRTRWNKELLAKEVLEELPDQLVDYMRAKGHHPTGKKKATTGGKSKDSFPSAPPPYRP